MTLDERTRKLFDSGNGLKMNRVITCAHDARLSTVFDFNYGLSVATTTKCLFLNNFAQN